MNLPPLPTPYYPQWSHSNEFEAFTADQVRQAQRDAVAAAVPEGWKLVPIAPTPAMKAAGAYASMLGQDIAHHTYSKMIAAAPGGER